MYLTVFFFVGTEIISSFPRQLSAGDIDDFCSLAEYYAARTPQSFRKVCVCGVVCVCFVFAVLFGTSVTVFGSLITGTGVCVCVCMCVCVRVCVCEVA